MYHGEKRERLLESLKKGNPRDGQLRDTEITRNKNVIFNLENKTGFSQYDLNNVSAVERIVTSLINQEVHRRIF